MPEVTRRRLLSSAALGAGGALASSLLPPALARAAAEGTRKGSLADVKHVVIHMQENRSFDHYFGTLAGVRGFSDPNVLIQSNGKSVFHQHESLDITVSSTAGEPTTALNDNWIPAHYAADGAAHYWYVMGYYEQQDI